MATAAPPIARPKALVVPVVVALAEQAALAVLAALAALAALVAKAEGADPVATCSPKVDAIAPP